MADTLDSEILLENLRVAVILIDHNHVIMRVNIAAETLLHRSRRNLVGKKLSEMIPLAAVEARISECLEDNLQFTLREVSIELSEKTALMDMTLSSVADVTGTQPGVLMEISSINRISRFMKDNNQLERQQSFRLMMRGLAHEIKNPLGGLRGAAQLLERELTEPGSRELTSILIKEADRLTRLVDRVMGSREQLKLITLNIHEVLEHVVHLVSVRSGSQLTVDRFYDPTLPDIVADHEQLIQALLNIVGNAVEAQEGSQQPRIGLITQFDRFVTINQQLHRQILKIKVWDEGPGVADHLRDNIFDPLISSRPSGSGLGLSITQEIIQRHKGIVQLEDYQGKTCFSISLPYLRKADTDSIEKVIQ